MKLLQALQVVNLAWRVGNRPQAKIVHMTEHGPAVLEGNRLTLLLKLDILVLHLLRHDQVRVLDGLAGLLDVALEQVQLVAHF